MAFASFINKYIGRCRYCGKSLNPGTRVYGMPPEPGKKWTIFCKDCADSMDPSAMAAITPPGGFSKSPSDAEIPPNILGDLAEIFGDAPHVNNGPKSVKPHESFAGYTALELILNNAEWKILQ